MVPPFIFKIRELLLGWEFDPVKANVIFSFSLIPKSPIEVFLVSRYQRKQESQPAKVVMRKMKLPQVSHKKNRQKL